MTNTLTREEKLCEELSYELKHGKHRYLPWQYGDRLLNGREDDLSNRQFARKCVNAMPTLLEEIRRLRIKCGEVPEVEIVHDYAIFVKINGVTKPVGRVSASTLELATHRAKIARRESSFTLVELKRVESFSDIPLQSKVVVESFATDFCILNKEHCGWVAGYSSERVEYAIIATYENIAEDFEYDSRISTQLPEVTTLHYISVPLNKILVVA